MRSSDARPIWKVTSSPESMPTRRVMVARYTEKAKKVPTVMRPSMTSQPPRRMLITSASCGRFCSSGWKRAMSFAARIFAANRVRPCCSSRSTSRSSCAKALTTRTPVTVCSTWVARSAADCWATHVAAYMERRDHTAMPTISGMNARAMTVSRGETHSMTPAVMMSWTMLPSAIGPIATRPCVALRSEIERDTICPVTIWSWLGPSRRCSRSRMRTRRVCCVSIDKRPAV